MSTNIFTASTVAVGRVTRGTGELQRPGTMPGRSRHRGASAATHGEARRAEARLGPELDHDGDRPAVRLGERHELRGAVRRRVLPVGAGVGVVTARPRRTDLALFAAADRVEGALGRA
jgi:hypothetical protein